MLKKILITITYLSLATAETFAQGNAISGGSTLLLSPSARAAGLGESFSAEKNDITGMVYNPAVFSSLSTAQASLIFQRGIADDTYSQIMIGAPTPKGGFGVSFGYYNGGSIDLYDGSTTRTVNAKKDLALSGGYAHSFGKSSIGFIGKYFSSELAETAKASAFAADFGAQFPFTSRIQVGAALQNMGTALKFKDRSNSLPRTVRLGGSFLLSESKAAPTLMLETAYLLNEKELKPSIGLETHVGPLSLRAGYRAGAALEGLSFGTGFILGNTSLDYAVGLVDQLNTRHRVSLSVRFGEIKDKVLVENKESVKFKMNSQALSKPDTKIQESIPDDNVLKETKNGPVNGPEVTKPTNVIPAYKAPVYRQTTPRIKKPVYKALVKKTVVRSSARKRSIYVATPKDTLESIAYRFYGDTRKWTKIYDANEKIINDPKVLNLDGQNLRIP
jgi:phage tail protein X